MLDRCTRALLGLMTLSAKYMTGHPKTEPYHVIMQIPVPSSTRAYETVKSAPPYNIFQKRHRALQRRNAEPEKIELLLHF